MLPVCPVVIPLLTAALLAALTKCISQRLSQAIALIGTLAALICCVLLMRASAAQPLVYWFGNFRPRQGIALGISFTVEPLGAGLAAFTSLLTLAALVFSSRYFDTVGNHFHALLLAFLAAMCGFCLTGDLFNMFVFFELMSAAGFALCGYKTDDPGSLQGALNFAVVNTIAAYFVLTGIGLLYARTGALNMAQMGRILGGGPLDSLVLTGFTFLVFGYLVKAAIAPFHFWLADAHAVAPTPVCILFSGVMVEMGLFALARLWWAVFDIPLHARIPAAAALFVSAGAVTAVIGSVMCWLQNNLKRLLAFSTIGHVGLMTVGIGLFTADGLAGTAVYVIGHGMVKAGLFLIAGILLHRFESVDERELHGKGLQEPWTAATFFTGAIALAGFPTSGLAAGDEMMDASASAAGFPWVRVLSLGVGALTSAAVLRAGGRIFRGWGPSRDTEGAPRNEEKPETESGHKHTPLSMILPAMVLITAGLFLGLVPGLTPAARSAAAQFSNSSAYAARVLNDTTVPAPRLSPTVSAGKYDGLIAPAAALAIAAAFLFSPGARRLAAPAGKLLGILHRIHSGHIGDYVAFLTFGIASFGLLCIYCLH